MIEQRAKPRKEMRYYYIIPLVTLVSGKESPPPQEEPEPEEAIGPESQSVGLHSIKNCLCRQPKA
jgi:hypothetical protein